MSIHFKRDVLRPTLREDEAAPSSVGVRGPLRILAPTRYPWLFNGPRHSRNAIEHRNFVPLNYMSAKLEGVTAFLPFPPRRFDLIHAFNRIPLGQTPFVIGFESHLPRAFGLEKSLYMRGITAMLASPRCRGIVAISDHAADIFRRQHAGSVQEEILLRKLTRRYPNVVISPNAVREHGPAATPERPAHLEVVFVGNHFGRKGGCVTSRLAEMAFKARLPVHFHIVSDLQVGGPIWTDPVDPAFFLPYKKLLELPNVRWRRSLPNAEVRGLLARCDLHILPTLGDTFGFSAIEAMAHGTPVLTTAQGALPEFIEHGQNGFLLPIETNEIREWVHLAAPDRHSQRFERLFAAEVERLAREACRILCEIVDARDVLPSMRQRARETAISLFDAGEASAFWDEYYERTLVSVQGRRSE